MPKVFSGRRLQQVRLATQKRPEQIALDVGRSVHTIRAYESGRILPSLDVALSLSDSLGCSVDDLLIDSAEAVDVA